jgi:hypothetical protein
MKRPRWISYLWEQWIPRTGEDVSNLLAVALVMFTVLATVWRVFEALTAP